MARADERRPTTERTTTKSGRRVPTRIRAGGRSEKVRQAVARACLDLLADGNVDFGHGDVAQLAGVTRATVYRWWPARTDLLREGLSLHTSRLITPDTGTWVGDVRTLAIRLATFFSGPIENSLNTILATRAHAEFDELMLEHYGPFVDEWRDVVNRAIDRGEVRPQFTAETVVNMLISPLLMAPMLGHRRPTRAEVTQIADFVLAATAAEPDPAHPARDPSGHMSSSR